MHRIPFWILIYPKRFENGTHCVPYNKTCLKMNPSDTQSKSCPALLITAPGSNHGKTTVTAALARYHVNQGRKVRVFKTGPDFLDPMLLEHACHQPVYNLDLWLTGETECRRLL